jgi:dTDP-glucose 4,6-dehydratase
MARHLVAGGSGFIGSHLVEVLLGRGDSVVVVDDFSTGRRSNLAAVAAHELLTIVEHDISQPLPAAVLDDRVDTVLDLASPASPDDFRTMPMHILATGSRGTWNLLDLAGHHSARFLLASTSEVYGDPDVHPQVETYWGNVDPIGPRACYDEAKRFGEALTMSHHRAHGTDVRIIRIFNTYGARLRPDDGRVVNTLIVQALTGAPLTLFGDGLQTRSFCHVDDQVRGMLAVLEGDHTGPFNVGNPHEVTMRELAELILELTGSTSTIELRPLPPERTGDPGRRCPDITAVNTVTGWMPAVSLRDGLQRTIDHFRLHEALV